MVPQLPTWDSKEACVSWIPSDRLDEMARTQTSPIDHGIAYDRGYLVANTCDALTMTAMAKEGRTLEALDSLITHAARAVQHGFTAGELDRAKRNSHSLYTSLGLEASTRTNREYVEEYIDHYKNGNYVPGVIAESRMLIDSLQLITLDDVNRYLRAIVGKDNVSDLHDLELHGLVNVLIIVANRAHVNL